MVLPSQSRTFPMRTNQNAFADTNGILTNWPTSPSADKTVEIQNTFFVGGVNFTIVSFL
jgi:hypothetical protein